MILEKDELRKILPQSEPILLVDQAELCEIEEQPGVTSQVYINPGWKVFQGHFKDNPVLPGVYILESMAQAADVMLLSMPGNQGKLPLFLGIAQLRFIRAVFPGDTLCCKASIVNQAGDMYDCKVEAWLGDEKVAQGRITLSLKMALAR